MNNLMGLNKTEQFARTRTLRFMTALQGTFNKATSAINMGIEQWGHLSAPQVITDDAMKIMKTLTNASMLSFSPFTIFKQVVQGFQTLGVKFGQDTFIRALGKAFTEEGDQVANVLRANGTLVSSNIIQDTANTFMPRLQQFIGAGLRPFQAADDGVRIAAHFVAEETFQRWAPKLLDGSMSEKLFLEATQLNTYGDVVQQQVLGELRAGRPANAIMTYGKILADNTMFSFTPTTKPSLFNTGIGRMFGTYGHYSMNMIKFVREGLSTGTAAQRIVFATRYMGIATMLGATMALAGIDSKSFAPLAPFTFSGGPYWQLMNDGLTILGGGAQGKAKLDSLINRAGILQYTMPGYRPLENFIRAITAAQNGTMFDGLRQLLGAPAATDESIKLPTALPFGLTNTLVGAVAPDAAGALDSLGNVNLTDPTSLLQSVQAPQNRPLSSP
jgi:hypothetical protein